MIMNNKYSTYDMSLGSKTLLAMSLASLWRLLMMPIDTCKTTMQVNGSLNPLRSKIKMNGISVLFHGSVASVSSTFASQFPWFYTYNYLFKTIPPGETKFMETARRGFIGFCASVFSDIVSNSIRVVKVYKQTHVEPITYGKVIRRIVSQFGLFSLFS